MGIFSFEDYKKQNINTIKGIFQERVTFYIFGIIFFLLATYFAFIERINIEIIFLGFSILCMNKMIYFDLKKYILFGRKK